MRRFIALLAATLLWVAGAWAQSVQPVPELTARVIDRTGTLDDIQRTGLEQKLQAFEQRKGTQIAMLLVATTQPEDIASYANRVANAWKIGRRQVGDGVLVVVAKNDRKVRIEVAKTLEGAIPDLAAKQVIDDAMTPRFRQGDFAGGLNAAADQLIARIDGEPLPAPAQRQQRNTAGFDYFDLAIFLFFAVPIAGTVLRGIFGGKLGPLITGGGTGMLALFATSSAFIAAIAGFIGLVLALLSGGRGSGSAARRSGWGGPALFPGGWSSGGGSSSSSDSGGGFSSGGGGDFGGGGASGDW
ncbi:TPM domain-containing protein [Ramlibacter humi]|uniref:YgcG family protein n=1 Tax=Ramlibacter humi TaxID=2530451 RepID=A0A4Z0BJS8_9BURK|nr:YgcG family protein [Ramlibacter humi]TFY98374.1 YgcG family protein [Ramlibacter humi]